MRLTVIFDKRAEGPLHTGWGLACLADGGVLFDTGEDGGMLTGNMKSLGIDPRGLKSVVISHDHWDHTGGLRDIMKASPGIEVYVCPGVSKRLKEEIRASGGVAKEAEVPAEITEGVFVTGEIAGRYRNSYMAEQALVVRTEKGASVITGCAHPGIVKIVRTVKEKFALKELYLVAGGFHLRDITLSEAGEVARRLREMGVKKAGPTHCTGDAQEGVFRKLYGQDFITLKAGTILDL